MTSTGGNASPVRHTALQQVIPLEMAPLRIERRVFLSKVGLAVALPFGQE